MKTPPPPPTTFRQFSYLPTEIRLQIWHLALEPRIIRMDNLPRGLGFIRQPSHQPPLLHACHESRDAAFYYGKYQRIIHGLRPVYFSPHLDYLWFDPLWAWLCPYHGHVPITTPSSIDHLLPYLGMVQNMIIHPNHSDTIMQPMVLFAKLPGIKRVLVAVDNMALNRVLFRTIYDVKSYYTAAKQHLPDLVEPEIKVCCLERAGLMQYAPGMAQESRLIGIFETGAEANAFLERRQKERGGTGMRTMEEMAVRSNRLSVLPTGTVKTGGSLSHRGGRLKGRVTRAVEDTPEVVKQKWQRFRSWCRALKHGQKRKGEGAARVT